jgi:MFS family permease
VTASQPVQRWAFGLLLVLVAVSLGVSGAPAPLYALYAQEWGFAPITTTVVFAVYAVAALAAVLVTGSISDRYGRRPVLVVAALLILLGLGLFIAADSVAWLLAARVAHGLGVGSVVVVASAALLDLRPDDGERTGRITGVVFNAGIALTLVTVALIVDMGPAPTVLPYVVLGAIVLVLLAGVLLMREPHTDERAVRLHVARPRVPREIAAHFRFSALGVMASWSVLGVLLSLYPRIASEAIGATSVLFGGAVVAGSAAASALSQAVVGRWPARDVAIVGDLGTGVSLVLCVPAVAWGHASAIAAASTLVGLFFGLAFGGSLRHLTQHVPSAHRGEVMSAFYVLAYGAMAVPTVLAGWAATVWSPQTIFAPFMITVALACTAAAVMGLRTRTADVEVADSDDDVPVAVGS